MLLQLSQFFPFWPPLPVSPFPPAITPASHFRGSCISSLASPFPIPFLTSPISYLPIMFLNSWTFSPFFPFPLPADNPPNNLHVYDSVPVLVICLVCFCFLDPVVGSCEFVALLMFVVLIFFFKWVPFTLHLIMAWRWWTPLSWPCLGSTLSALQF